MATGEGHTELIGDYNVFKGHAIGSGGFGTVYHASRRSDGTVVAAKEIVTRRSAIKEVISFYNRPKVQHVNVIQMFEIERLAPTVWKKIIFRHLIEDYSIYSHCKIKISSEYQYSSIS